MLSKARLQFADVQYVGGPQIDDLVATTYPIELVSRWILGRYFPPLGGPFYIAYRWFVVQPIAHHGGLGFQRQNPHEDRLPPGYVEDGGEEAFPFCGQSGSEPKEDWWSNKPPLNTCRHRLRKDGQRCGGRRMRGVPHLIVRIGSRAGSVYRNLGSGCIQSNCPGFTAYLESAGKRRKSVESIWEVIRGVVEYRESAGSLRSWGSEMVSSIVTFTS